ncbi:hypothetical protein [Clostridium haemolyticum]|uniref:Uncharacterized protein n=1 Tax=Clostridium haemolyticum NCTC 9693 TaxID=1443114 RepID=A0ABR4TB53_CLOHA|nr:hypothetical protein [Clostridium haemolyticum]KEI14168.1 hypothetical protein Z960_p0176 [Clostridium haemolyticum NCTC 9693]
MVAKKSQTKTNLKKKDKSDHKICLCCGKERMYNTNNFYQNISPYINNRIAIGKKCMKDIVKYDDMESIFFILHVLNKPFIKEKWEECLNSDKDTWGEYIKQMSSLPQYKDLTWKDTNYTDLYDNEIIKNTQIQAINNNKHNNVENISQWEQRWGKGFTTDDYKYLDNFYSEYTKSYATDTPVQKNLYKNIARVHLQAEKEFMTGNITNFNKLMETSSKLHNDGNIKPIQSTGANDDKGLSTYGLWIKMIENDEPCEIFDKKPLFADFDSVGKYFSQWIVRPFKKIFGLEKSE